MGSVPGLARWPCLQLVAVDGITVVWGGAAGASQGTLLVDTDGSYRQRFEGARESMPGSARSGTTPSSPGTSPVPEMR